MSKGRITKKAVDALVCPIGKDRAFLWDDAVSGFGVAIFPSGKRFYVAQYRHSGRSRRLTLGEHGRLTPEEARTLAKKVLGTVAHGSDPIVARQAARAVPTFREAAELYMAKHVLKHRKPRTGAGYETLLRLYVLPALGSMSIAEIRRTHVQALHDKVAEKPGAANRALAVFSAVWTWAATKAFAELGLPISPARGIERNREDGRERYLSTAELGRLGDVLREAETSGLKYIVDESGPNAKHAPKVENRVRRIDPFAIGAIRLLLFTGARLREILHARWSELDLERGLINLPAARSKSGKKSIVLNAPAKAVLASLPRVDGNPHVFPGEAVDKNGEGRPRADLKAPWKAIVRAADLGDLRIHDLRHSHAATGAGLGLGLQMIGKLLGHTQPTTTARYAHLDADPVRQASDTIGAAITGALERRSVQIVPLK